MCFVSLICPYTILAPTCINPFIFGFVQVNLTLNSYLWVYSNFIMKFSRSYLRICWTFACEFVLISYEVFTFIFLFEVKECTLGVHFTLNLESTNFSPQYHLINLGVHHYICCLGFVFNLELLMNVILSLCLIWKLCINLFGFWI